MIIGNVTYSLASNIWLLLAGRFIVGIAAANYAVAQTYLSYVTTQANRTKVMALNSAANVLGFIIGPGINAISFCLTITKHLHSFLPHSILPLVGSKWIHTLFQDIFLLY